MEHPAPPGRDLCQPPPSLSAPGAEKQPLKIKTNTRTLSQNWFADDTFDTFTLWWGNGERVNDSTALGGTAFRLRPGGGIRLARRLTGRYLILQSTQVT